MIIFSPIFKIMSAMTVSVVWSLNTAEEPVAYISVVKIKSFQKQYKEHFPSFAKWNHMGTVGTIAYLNKYLLN